MLLENRLIKCLSDHYGYVVNGVGVLFHTDYCLVLHLQMKLKYFQQHRWSKAWVDTAKEIVREEFAKYKVPQATAATSVCH